MTQTIWQVVRRYDDVTEQSFWSSLDKAIAEVDRIISHICKEMDVAATDWIRETACLSEYYSHMDIDEVIELHQNILDEQPIELVTTEDDDDQQQEG